MIKLFRKQRILLFLIFLICFGSFLRLHNLSNLYIFGFDEEYQATYAMTLVKHIHPIWIGVSASFLDYYLGPYFTYFTAFWLLISHGDPLLTAYIAALVGVIISVVIFFVGWKFFNLTTGIISSLLYAGLPIIVFYDQKYWNPMFVQLIVLLMFISLMLIKKSSWWWLLYTGTVGSIFQTDLAPLPLTIIGIWIFIKGKYFLNKKLVISCILLFLLFYWPLVVFDYFHNFSNITVLSRYSSQAKQAGAKFNPVSKLNSALDTMGRFWYLAPNRPNADELNIFCNQQRTNSSKWLWGLSLILLMVFLFISFKSQKISYHLLTYFVLISLGFYIIYTGGSFEYYLHGFITLFTFIPAVLISRLKGKYKLISILLLMVVLAIGFNTILTSSDKYSLGQKKKLIARVMNIVGNGTYSINKMGDCHIYEGWRYLFKIYAKAPARSFTDQNFAWLYPHEVSFAPLDYDVILSGSEVLPSTNLTEYNRINQGGFSAYVNKLKK